MAAPDTETQAVDLLPTQTRESLGTVRSHPRVRITGSSQHIRVSASIARRCRTYRRRHQAPLQNGGGERSFYLRTPGKFTYWTASGIKFCAENKGSGSAVTKHHQENILWQKKPVSYAATQVYSGLWNNALSCRMTLLKPLACPNPKL
jgi:hypothetical protein